MVLWLTPCCACQHDVCPIRGCNTPSQGHWFCDFQAHLHSAVWRCFLTAAVILLKKNPLHILRLLVTYDYFSNPTSPWVWASPIVQKSYSSTNTTWAQPPWKNGRENNMMHNIFNTSLIVIRITSQDWAKHNINSSTWSCFSYQPQLRAVSVYQSRLSFAPSKYTCGGTQHTLPLYTCL